MAESSPFPGPGSVIGCDDPRPDRPQEFTLTSHDEQATLPDDSIQDSPKKMTYNPLHGPKIPLRTIRQKLIGELKAGKLYQFPPFQISKKRKIHATMIPHIRTPMIQQLLQRQLLQNTLDGYVESHLQSAYGTTDIRECARVGVAHDRPSFLCDDVEVKKQAKRQRARSPTGEGRLQQNNAFLLLDKPRPGRPNAKKIKTKHANYNDAPVPTIIVTTPEGEIKHPCEFVDWPARDTRTAWFVRPIDCEKRPMFHMSSGGGRRRDRAYDRRLKKCALYWLDFQEWA